MDSAPNPEPEDEWELTSEEFEKLLDGLSSDPDNEKGWELSSEALYKLLRALGSDLDSGAREYERIREKLITFFESRSCPTPDEHTDIVINRVAKKIDQGSLIFTSKPVYYFLGVARMVLKECWRAMTMSTEIIESSLTHIADSPTAKSESEHPDNLRAREEEQAEKERKLDCLERCLASLSPKDRAIILSYYKGEKSLKIRNRKKMADRLGLQMNALRIKALRIRKSLEYCVNDCLGQYSPE